MSPRWCVLLALLLALLLAVNGVTASTLTKRSTFGGDVQSEEAAVVEDDAHTDAHADDAHTDTDAHADDAHADDAHADDAHADDAHADDGHHDDGHGHHSFDAAAEKRAFLFLVVLVVVITVVFERLEHSLKHHTPKLFQDVLNQALSELTVLGFIGVVALVISKPFAVFGKNHDGEAQSLMNLLSELFFHDPEHLEHRFHEVHYQIFTLMIAFIFMVSAFLVSISLFSRQYHVFERAAKDMHKVAAENAANPGSPTTWHYKHTRIPLEFLFVTKTSLSEHQVFRDSVVESCSAIRHHKMSKNDTVVANFDFGEYRTRMEVKSVVSLLKLTEPDWLFVVVVILFFVLAHNEHDLTALVCLWVLLSITNLVVVSLWVRNCHKAKLELLPCAATELCKFEEGKSYSDPPINVTEGRQGFPLYSRREIKPRESKFEKWFYEVPANRHEQLFWGENKQAKVMPGVLRCCSFFNVIQIACTLSLGRETIFNHNANGAVVGGIICVVCYVGVLLLVLKGLNLYGLVSSVGKMVDVQVAEDVCEQVRIRKSKQVWDAMTTVERLLNKSEKTGGHVSRSPEEERVEERVREGAQTFCACGDDGEVHMSYTQAEALMREVWPEFTDVEPMHYAAHLRLMDLDKSGSIELEEFVDVTLQQYHNARSKAHPNDKLIKLLDRIFLKFDADGDGHLDLEELGRVFKEKSGNSQFNLVDIFEEMDTSGDKKVSREEFEAFVSPAMSSGGAESGHH